MLSAMKLTTTFLLIVVAFLIAYWIVDSSQAFQTCIREGENNAANQDLHDEVASKFGVYRHCLGAYVIEKNPAITAIATVLLAIITAGLVWSGIEQRKTTRAQLWAYVFISGASVSNAAQGDGALESHVVIKNFGQTPAYKVVNVDGLALDRYPPPTTLNLLVANHEFSTPGRSKSDLGPTQSEAAIQIARRPPLSQQERQALINGQLVIYVYGEVRYFDAFGQRRWTKYRFMMGGPVGIRPGGQLVACEDGNEAT